MELEEDHFLVWYHQEVNKSRQKVWHDHLIKYKSFKIDDLVLI